MKGFDQGTIRKVYRLWARPYGWLAPLYLLGNEGRLRRRTVSALALAPGQRVLDVACGTGRNFPYIMKQIGPQGHLIGLDYTPEMLAEAERLVASHDWHNVTLLEGDAAKLSLDTPVDASLSTLAMSVIPDFDEALQRMLAAVRPGGRVAIADARRSGHAFARPLNLVADWFGWFAAADLSRRPWEMLAGLVQDFRYETFFLGLFYVAAGHAPHERA